MWINIDTLRKTKGIGAKTLERVIEQHNIDNDIKAFESEYIPSDKYTLDKDINLWQGDCLELMNHIPNDSVDFVLCDPPYFLDGMGVDWSKIDKNVKDTSSKVVTNLPAGMKFSTENNSHLYDFMLQVGRHFIRIMKDGSLGIVFSQSRLAHVIATALEDAGLEIREVLFWQRKSMPKAQNLKRYGILDDVVTPQPLQQLEVMILFRVPANNFVDPYNNDGVGMMNYNRSTIYNFDQDKDTKHPTQKPIQLLEELLLQFTSKDMLILDNTMGSASTGVACKNTGRRFIGIELDRKYFNIAKQRIERDSDE